MAPPSNGYPTFTASIPRPRVRWLTTVFDPARSVEELERKLVRLLDRIFPRKFPQLAVGT